MKAYASFRERALHESQRYGDDPYVFLRELVQNARDAGARLVRVNVSVEAGRARIVFEDDGSGMTFKHAKGYLFRLYASSKENQADAVGHFGVGFWSVLRWTPESLRIESRTGDSEGATDAWGVELDASLSKVTDVRCALSSGGTRIVMERATRDDDLVNLARTVRERLAYYCRYVRVRGGKERLHLWCNGERVDRELDVASVMEDSGSEATLAMSFSSAGAAGIVALAATPKVQLYARGLLVSEATVLDELDGAASGRRDGFGTSGLAPVVVLNSDRLDVVLSRRKARDSRELRRLMRLARARLDRLVSHAVDGVVERSFLDKTSDAIAEGVRALGGGLAVAVLAVWLLVIAAGALAALLLWRGPQGGAGERPVMTVVRGPTAAAADGYRGEAAPVVGSSDVAALTGGSRPVGNIVGYGGAIVDVPDTYGPTWSFGYRGPSRVFFKALTLDRYESGHGFVRRELPITGPYQGVACGRGARTCIDVVTQVVANDTPFVLPVPTGHGVVDHSVTIDGAPQELSTNAVGEALLRLESGRRGTLRYQVAPAAAAAESPPLPAPLTLGEPWDSLLARAVKLPVHRRVEMVTSTVRD
ncbi:MAG TPA: ATP-binding protein, partial [Myxococcota bacterium]|nr:ATP-binding protein [Myxococcota bacterium]